MNQYETKTNGTLIADAPLFASVWLALFNELRKNFVERRLMTDANMESLDTIKEK